MNVDCLKSFCSRKSSDRRIIKLVRIGSRAMTVGLATLPIVFLTQTSADAVAKSHTKSQVVVSKATVTATKQNGDSAISLTLMNSLRGPISIMSISSKQAPLSMLDYDVNMCQGNHGMVMLANLLIPSGYTQHLGTRYQGAMLFNLRRQLVVGTTIPLEIKWSDFSSAHTTVVEATVITAPKGIKFIMSGMRM